MSQGLALCSLRMVSAPGSCIRMWPGAVEAACQAGRLRSQLRAWSKEEEANRWRWALRLE